MKKIILTLIVSFIWTIQIYSQWGWDNKVTAHWTTTSFDRAKYVKVKGGSVYVTGNCFDINSSGYAIMTIKYDPNLNEIWRAIYTNPNGQQYLVYVNGIDVDNDGNVYIAGFINKGTNDDYLTIKYNTNGGSTDPVWTQTFNGTGNGYDHANAIGVDDGSSGSVNVYVTGGSYTTHPDGSINLDIVTISYESTSGNIRTGWPQWFQNGYYPDGDDEALALAISNTTGTRGRQGVYVAGWADNGPTKKDAQLVYYDFNGGSVKEMHYGCGGCPPYETGDDFANAVVVSPVTGDIFCTGGKWCGEGQCNLGRCNWASCLPGSYEVFTARFFWLTAEDECMECSSIYPPNTYPCLAVDECYCDNARYDGPMDGGEDVGNSLVVYHDPVVGGDFVYATGYTQQPLVGDVPDAYRDYITLKYNHSEGINQEHGSKGVIRGMWCTECYPTYGEGIGCPRATCPTIFNSGGNVNDIARSIAIDASGNNVFVTGTAGNPSQHIVTIQYNSSGSQVCLGEYYDVNAAIGNSISVDDGNPASVYVAGETANFQTYLYDFVVLKYTAGNCSGDKKSSNPEAQKLKGVPEKYGLSQNFPNPFNPSTTINYSVPKASYVSLKIYNTLGQTVMSIPVKYRGPGYYSEDINASSWTSGIYFYKIEARDVLNTANTFIDTKKMLLIK